MEGSYSLSDVNDAGQITAPVAVAGREAVANNSTAGESRPTTPQRLDREHLCPTPPRENKYSHKRELSNPIPQSAPGSHSASAAGHTLDNSIPLSIFPIATDKFCFCFCGLPGRGKTHISRKLAR
jgi:Cdc6-like AAA superfamily ATPase